MISTFKHVPKHQYPIYTHKEVDIFDSFTAPDLARGAIAKISRDTRTSQSTLCYWHAWIVADENCFPLSKGHRQAGVLDTESETAIGALCVKTTSGQELRRLERSSVISAAIHTPNSLMVSAISNNSGHPRPFCKICRSPSLPRHDLRRWAEAPPLVLGEKKNASMRAQIWSPSECHRATYGHCMGQRKPHR
jgi:hypothetical protein